MLLKDQLHNLLINSLDSYSIEHYKIYDKEKFVKEYINKTINFYNNLLSIKDDLIEKKISNKETIILLEYAGFGDTIHTKLIIQHIKERYKNIVWITLDLIKDLYREHEELLIYSNKINNDLRNPQTLITQLYSNILLQIFEHVFKQYDNKIDISNNIIKSHLKNPYFSFLQHYFNIFNIKRDLSIRHYLQHSQDIMSINDITKPLIGFEHCSKSFSFLTNINKYQNIINNLKNKYDIILFGSLDDPKLENAIDYRGKSFYDVFSILKKCKYFIGRNSANQQLTAFLPELTVLEIDTIVSSTIDFKTCGYVKNTYNVNDINQILEIIK